MDVIIRRGTVVTSESIFRADVGILDGKIAQIGGDMAGSYEIEADGRLVTPGGIDAHVHFTNDFRLNWFWVDDFYSGSVAAAAGGVTSVGSMTFAQSGERLAAALERTQAEAQENAIIDFFQHPVVVDPSPETIAEIPLLAKAGHTSVKFFTMIEQRTELEQIRAMEAAARNGMLIMVHCEDQAINAYCVERLIAEGKRNIQYYPDSRPTFGEAVATARALAVARSIDSAIYIVHLSCRDALDEVRKTRAAGQLVYVETRPVYLYLNRDRYGLPEGAKYVSFPPLRDQSDMDALWSAIRSGEINTYCSDHAPLDRAQSLNPELTLGSFGGAMPGVETLLPLLYSEGVRKGRISLNRWVELSSTNAAKLFGLFPRKGAIAVGSDADLVVWDPSRRRTIQPEEMHSKSDFDVYEGMELHGWPAYTVSRGEVVFADGKVIGRRGRGRPVRRESFRPL